MIGELEREYRKELFKLMQENPDLPVIPFVDTEVVAGDGFGKWMGSWGNARVDEFLIPARDWEPIIYKSENFDVSDTLEKYLSYEEFDKLPDVPSEWLKRYDVLPWQKAIIVDIVLPE